MVEKKILIKKNIALDEQVCAQIVDSAREFESSVTFSKGTIKVDAKTVIGVMNLKVEQGETLIITCNGEDEDQQLLSIQKVFKELELI